MTLCDWHPPQNTLLCKRFAPVLQFLSFAPAMGHWIVDYKVSSPYVLNAVLAFSILLPLTGDISQTQCTLC